MLHLILENRKSRVIAAHARPLAEANVQGVVQLVQDQISEMTTSEIRGFVRARAAHGIRRSTRIRLAGRRRLPQECRIAIIHKATDLLIPLVMHELWKTPGPW